MKTKKMDVVHKDSNPQNNHIDNLQAENHEPKIHEWMDEYVFEIEFALQDWGIKNELLLFGTKIYEYYDPQKKVLVPHAQGIFTDNGSKELFILGFNVKRTGKKIIITRKEGFKYPLKILRSRNLITRDIMPVEPFYNVLIGRGLILPFQSHVKGKKRDVLPFEDMGHIAAIKI
jgi:hypothetical protein